MQKLGEQVFCDECVRIFKCILYGSRLYELCVCVCFITARYSTYIICASFAFRLFSRWFEMFMTCE